MYNRHFPKGDIRLPEPFDGLCINLAHADNLNCFFLRRLFQSIDRFAEILPVCDFSPARLYLVPVLEKRDKAVDSLVLRHKPHKAAASVVSGLVAVKAEIDGLNVWTVREET